MFYFQTHDFSLGLDPILLLLILPFRMGIGHCAYLTYSEESESIPEFFVNSIYYGLFYFDE